MIFLKKSLSLDYCSSRPAQRRVCNVYQVLLLAAGLCIKSLKSQLFLSVSVCPLCFLRSGEGQSVSCNKCSGCICIVPPTVWLWVYQHCSNYTLITSLYPQSTGRERERENSIWEVKRISLSDCLSERCNSWYVRKFNIERTRVLLIILIIHITLDNL